MFTNDISLTGKHAYYTKLLSPREEQKDRAFNRYIDVYMTGAVIGFINGRQEVIDQETEHKAHTANIFLDVIQRERGNLEVIFRTIMLLEDNQNTKEEDRINRAFRDDLSREQNDKHTKNMKLFNSYVRGGISFLYDKIGSNSLDREELISNINDFVEDFNNEFILNMYTEDIEYDTI